MVSNLLTAKVFGTDETIVYLEDEDQMSQRQTNGNEQA
jgi:hypothetical protein